MFQKLTDLEKSMQQILKSIKNSDKPQDILKEFNADKANTFHECIKSGYVENVIEHQDANFNYHFDIIQNCYINKNGLKFMRDMSLGFRIKNAVFDVLKGTLGFLLGILSTVIAEYIIWVLISQ